MGSMIKSLAIVTLVFSITAFAQESAPVLSQDDKLLATTLRELAVAADGECRKLDSTKRYEATRTQVMKRLSEKYPGYTLNLQTLTLVVAPKQEK